ncbi:MAG: hypothetical protein EOM50_15530 [Erysipelotrichia bacterium]|nr:hypothetical protein [Erysipelotrichia bacterium]
MTDYKKMYLLLCKAASDSLDILSEGYDIHSINSVQFWLKEAMIRAEYVYMSTAESDGEDERDE